MSDQTPLWVSISQLLRPGQQEVRGRGGTCADDVRQLLWPDLTRTQTVAEGRGGSKRMGADLGFSQFGSRCGLRIPCSQFNDSKHVDTGAGLSWTGLTGRASILGSVAQDEGIPDDRRRW